eukprot:364241-Chlamydomonas_euryale.AAC.2
MPFKRNVPLPRQQVVTGDGCEDRRLLKHTYENYAFQTKSASAAAIGRHRRRRRRRRHLRKLCLSNETCLCRGSRPSPATAAEAEGF